MKKYYNFVTNSVLETLNSRLEELIRNENNPRVSIGLHKAVKVVEDLQKSNDVQKISPDTMIMISKFAEAYELLKQGKKVQVNMNYVYPSIPTIKLKDFNGKVEGLVKLDCIPETKFGKYTIESDIPLVDEVSVISYSSGKCKKIKYIYANPQMNRLFAVLEDGTEEDFKWSMLDMWWSYEGEYIPETPLESVKVKIGECCVYYFNIPKDSSWQQIKDEVLKYLTEHPEYKGLPVIVSSDLLPYEMYISNI